MAFEFKFPDLGEGIQEGVLIKWLVQEGDEVNLDQPFAVVETDKAVVEMPSPTSGTILKLHYAPGNTIKVGSVMVTFGEVGEKAPQSAVKPVKTDPVGDRKDKTGGDSGTTTSKRHFDTDMGQTLLATPHTRALARKLGVELTNVTATGKGGRITDEDVQRTVESRNTEEQKEGPVQRQSVIAEKIETTVKTKVLSQSSDQEIERIPLSHLRKVIADNMIQSKQTSAHVTHVDEADVTELFGMYQKAKDRLSKEKNIKISLLPFFMKAALAALRSHPLLNATYDEKNQVIEVKHFYNFGMAVDAPDGLIVPVIKSVERKDMLQLAGEIVDYAERARDRKLHLDELRGGTFTITNIGPIGGLFATPIIRQPELAILGIHSIKDRPVVRDGEIVIRKMMYLSISFDHRIIDGAEAARFMSELVSLIENPEIFMMRLG